MATSLLAEVVPDVANLIHAVAALAWPIVVIVALLLFRSEFQALLGRVKRGKAGPIEFELEDQLSELGERTEEARASLPTPPEPEEAAEEHAVAERVLNEAATSPRLALIVLSAEIERKAQEVLASSQDPATWRNRPLAQTIQRLELSPPVRAAYQEFREVRNAIVHGGKATDADALRAIDYGLMILDAIERVPREIHRVVVPSAETFADELGTHQCGFDAVVLEFVNSVDGAKTEHAYPTTKDYKEGQIVSWEWGSQEYPEAWYRDPRDGSIKYGWTASLEFGGRPIEEI